MTRLELARKINDELEIDFYKALIGIDLTIDDLLGKEINTIPEDIAKDIFDGFAEQINY